MENNIENQKHIPNHNFENDEDYDDTEHGDDDYEKLARCFDCRCGAYKTKTGIVFKVADCVCDCDF